MVRRKRAKSQFEICTRDCQARCCRYLTVEVPAPRGRADWDEMRWWLAHEGVMVSRDDEGWLLHVQTPCTNLRADNACGVYPYHMGTCKEYDARNCEFTGPLEYDVLFREELDLARYLEKRKLKRGAAVARDIRMARRQATRNGGAGLVQLQRLSPPGA